MKPGKCNECFYNFTQKKITLDDIINCMNKNGARCVVYTFCPEQIKNKYFAKPEIEKNIDYQKAKKTKKEYIEPYEHEVEDVSYSFYEKNYKISMKVTYSIGELQSVSEWVCIEHGGYAEKMARKWLKENLPDGYPIPDTVEECLNMKDEYKKPSTIYVDYNKDFPRIISKIF